jgi:hypothetical protein
MQICAGFSCLVDAVLPEIAGMESVWNTYGKRMAQGRVLDI